MPGTGFTSISQYMGANSGTLAREHDELLGGVNGQIDAAKATADKAIAGVKPGSDPTAGQGYLDALTANQHAQDAAQQLGSTAGLANLIGDRYHTSGDQSMFDASLFGGGIQSDAAQRARSLSGYLDDGTKKAAAGKPFVADHRDPTPYGPPAVPAGTARKLGIGEPLAEPDDEQLANQKPQRAPRGRRIPTSSEDLNA